MVSRTFLGIHLKQLSFAQRKEGSPGETGTVAGLHTGSPRDLYLPGRTVYSFAATPLKLAERISSSEASDHPEPFQRGFSSYYRGQALMYQLRPYICLLGRSHFIFPLIGGKQTHSWVKLSKYSHLCKGPGSVLIKK